MDVTISINFYDRMWVRTGDNNILFEKVWWEFNELLTDFSVIDALDDSYDGKKISLSIEFIFYEFNCCRIYLIFLWYYL